MAALDPLRTPDRCQPGRPGDGPKFQGAEPSRGGGRALERARFKRAGPRSARASAFSSAHPFRGEGGAWRSQLLEGEPGDDWEVAADFPEAPGCSPGAPPGKPPGRESGNLKRVF